MVDCKYSFGDGHCPTMTAARNLVNNHVGEAGVYRMIPSNARVSGAVIAHDAFLEVYCRNEGKDCAVKSHLDRVYK